MRVVERETRINKELKTGYESKGQEVLNQQQVVAELYEQVLLSQLRAVDMIADITHNGKKEAITFHWHWYWHWHLERT